MVPAILKIPVSFCQRISIRGEREVLELTHKRVYSGSHPPEGPDPRLIQPSSGLQGRVVLLSAPSSMGWKMAVAQAIGGVG